MPESSVGSPGPSDWPRMAVVCHTHPSVSKGGAEIAAYSLFRGLRGLGVEALFVAACPEADRARLHLGTPHERALFYEPSRYDHLYHEGSPVPVRELVRILAAERVGIANFHHFLFLGLGAIRAAKAHARTATVLTLHEYLAICQHHGQMVTRPARALCGAASADACGGCFPELDRAQLVLRRERFLDAFRAVDRFVSPSGFLAARYAAWGLDRGRISVIENGLPAHGGPAPGGAAPRRQGASWIFGYFGQITPFKGVDVLLAACRLIAGREDLAGRIQIRVHGNLVGQPRAFVERFERAAGEFPFLSYLGPYTNANARGLMADCDYILVPSTWWENSPVVVQEAYASRRPVLCSGIGGLAEKVVDGSTGLHFRPGDAASLVQALERAMSESLFDALVRNLPMPSDEGEMARSYLECFKAAAAGAAGEVLGPPVRAPERPSMAMAGQGLLGTCSSGG